MFSRFLARTARLSDLLSATTEIKVYARRLLSHDRIGKEELSLYALRRRQALLFLATQQSQHLRSWREAHPDDARFCTEEAWATIPTDPSLTRFEQPLTLPQRANIFRILSWWEIPLGKMEHLPSLALPALNLIEVGHLDFAKREMPSPSHFRIKGILQHLELEALSMTPQKEALSGRLPCLGMGGGRILAAPCPEGGKYHLLSDIFHFDWDPVEGSSLATDLDSRLEFLIKRPLPFHLNLSDLACNCGRPFPVLDVWSSRPTVAPMERT